MVASQCTFELSGSTTQTTSHMRLTFVFLNAIAQGVASGIKHCCLMCASFLSPLLMLKEERPSPVHSFFDF